MDATSAHVSLFSVMSFLNIPLLTVGLYQIFPKFGVKRKWAFVPFLRYYKLAQCADREISGRLLVGCMILYYIIGIGQQYMTFEIQFAGEAASDFQMAFYMLQFIFIVMLGLCQFIYSIRIYAGLCNQLRKKKIWIIVFFIMSCIPLMIWGMDAGLTPKRRLDGARHVAGESGITAEAMDEGLTINIKERTAVEFLKKKRLLRDIHMNIKPGHMVLLLGGSGAGKTTFVNAVTGYEKANAEILLNGGDVYTEYQKMKYEIGLVPQMDLMRYEDTVEHTLKDAAKLRLPTGIPHKEMKARIERVLDIFGLVPVRDNMVVKLSGGQKKRLSIATEFICDPDLFILDEPDSGLDGVMARELMTRLHDISREGKIVIVITHTPDRVIDLFDDVIVLAKDADHTGRLAYFGPIAEAKTFFGKNQMEEVVKAVNRKEEGGEGLADHFIEKYGEAVNGKAKAIA